MALNFRKFIEGLRIVPKAVSTASEKGDLDVSYTSRQFAPADVNTSTEFITISSHGFSNNDIVNFSSSNTLPSPLVTSTNYYIISATANTFQVSLTLSGPAENLSSQGTGTHTVVRPATGVLNYHNGASASPIVTEVHSAILTNKTIDADQNTLSNIEDGDIKVGANIARSKLAAGTVSSVVVNNASGIFSDLSLTSAQIILGDASGVPTATTVTGEVTIGNTGVTTVGTVANSVISGLLQTQMQSLAVASTISPTKSFVRLNSGSGAIDGIAAGTDGQHLVLLNLSGAAITLRNQSGIVGANDRIVTGSNGDLTLENTASLFLIYNNTDVRWYVIGGVGGSSTFNSVGSNAAVVAYNAVYLDSSSIARQLDATTDTTVEFVGVSLDVGGSGSVRVQVAGEVDIPTALIEGGSFVVGKPVYASVSNPGKYQSTLPFTAGLWIVPVGIATTATKMVINGAGSSTAVKITSEVDAYVYANVATAPGTSGNVTLTNSNSILLVNASTAPRTITLPLPTAGKIFNIKKIDSSGNTVIIAPPSGTIDGAGNKTISSQYDSITITSDGVNYFLI